MKRLLLLVLGLALPLGCDALNAGPGGGGGPRDDEGVTILDDGFPDAGPVIDAGAPADAGPPVFNLDGGLPFPLDGGFIEYEGAPEDGVRCGAALETCAVGTSCCVGGFPVAGVCSTTNDDVCPVELTSNLACDGAEDCGEAEACCLGGDIATGLTTTCSAPATCAANEAPPVCTSTAECPQGLTCCGIVGAFLLPVDLGVCSPVCAGGI